MSRGTHNRTARQSDPSITDSQRRLIRTVGKAQTFLSAAQVDELVELHGQGLTLGQIRQRLGVHHRTVAAHLVRRSVPPHTRGLAAKDAPKAMELYESRMTLTEVGRYFGVS